MKKIFKDHIVAIFLFLFFFVAYFFVLVIKHDVQFQTFGLDLGFYDQIIHKASDLDFSKSTIAEVVDINYYLSFFENDFHLPLLAIALFYKLWPSIYWIFFSQTLFSALIGLLLYFAAFKKTGSKFFALAIMFATLLSVPFQHVIFDGFTPEVFGAFFLALCFLSIFLKSKPLIYLSALGMVISKVEFSPIVFLVGIILILFEKQLKTGFVLIIFGAFSFIFLVYFLNPLISPDYQNYAHLSLGYGQIGQNPVQVIVNIFTKPLLVLDAVINPAIKLNYLFQQLFSFGFLPIGGIFSWPLLGYELFTRMGNNVMIAKWPLHSYTISTTLAIGTIYFGAYFRQKSKIVFLSLWLFVFAVLGDLFFHGPLNSFLKPSFYRVPIWAKNNHEIFSQIPKTAAVSANNSLVPHLSQRDKIYIFPNIADAQYVALDLANRPNSFTPSNFEKAQETFLNLIQSGQFKIIYKQENVVLLKRT